MSTMHPTNTSNRFCIGIDLGTSNCAVSYFDREKPASQVQLFRIPQLGKFGAEESFALLPSSLYLDETGQRTVGVWASVQGAKVPTRLVHSAKSWLSNPAASRKEKILPFEAANQNERVSPLEASTLYLEHIIEAWNRQIAKGNARLLLEEQDIVVTVPASFDEVARALTVEAAAKAGLKNLTLLEEPQAAFYNWLMEKGSDTFKRGESILVCDVGGGTTDFSLIDVVEENHKLEMRRMAVGKHLLLGGDNMDAALSYTLQAKMNQELDTTQRLELIHQMRAAKEALLKEKGVDVYSIFLSGKGSQVVGGSVSSQITRQEVETALLEGFFGIYSWEEALQHKRGSGIRQMGLAYEAEPSITKHLAQFLNKNNRTVKPTYLLFNGGAMKPPLFQKRIVESLNVWFGKEKQTTVLDSGNLDLAVARGAAYFAKLRQNQGTLIGGGIPRSYYLEIEVGKEKKALTLLPRGVNEGTKLVSEHQFSLMPNQPVAFHLYQSHTRLNDQPGELISVQEEDLNSLAPIHTLCKYGKKENKEPIPVQLEISLTPIGVLELWLLAKNTEHRWKLEFQVSGEIQQRRLADETVDATSLQSAKMEIQNAFAVGSQDKLTHLMASLETALDKTRNTWSPSVLRELYEIVYAQADKRLLSTHYESRFWNLTGFLLRPGMGYPLDDFRLKQLWKLILADQKKQKNEEVELQQWICYRRIAAGLSKGCQIQLFNELLLTKQKKSGYAYAEHLRALASFELIDLPAKIKLGTNLLRKITSGKGEPCDYWALGRVGARQLFHGTAANVIAPKICEEWITALTTAPQAQNCHLPFTLALLARKTGCPEIDLPNALLEKIAPQLADMQDLLLNERPLTEQEQDRFFGDALPTGLIFANL